MVVSHSTLRAGIQGAHDLELAAAALAESVDLQLPPLDVPAHLQRAARVLGLPHVRRPRRCCGTGAACPSTASRPCSVSANCAPVPCSCSFLQWQLPQVSSCGLDSATDARVRTCTREGFRVEGSGLVVSDGT